MPTAISKFAAPNSEIRELDDATTWTGTTGATWTSNGTDMMVTRYTSPTSTFLGSLEASDSLDSVSGTPRPTR